VQIVTGDGSETIDPPALPEGERDGVSYFLARLRDGRPIMGLGTPEVGRDVQEILGAALESSATGRTVALARA
jgi:predicted dehydrogenase